MSDMVAVNISSSSPLIDHCHIHNNASSGVCVAIGTVTISDNVISNNSARYDGGGIYAENCSTNETTIQAHIYDWNDDASLGEIIFQPIATAPI